jgi:hypothetical protein
VTATGGAAGWHDGARPRLPRYLRRRQLVAKTPEVAFGKGWVVMGEPIAYPSMQNPKRVSTEGACFSKAVFDDGGDLRPQGAAK